MSAESRSEAREGQGGGEGRRGRRGGRGRIPFAPENGEFKFDYKNPQQLRYFISDRGKIVPRRISGLTAKEQRRLTLAIKRARNIALLPYTAVR